MWVPLFFVRRGSLRIDTGQLLSVVRTTHAWVRPGVVETQGCGPGVVENNRVPVSAEGTRARHCVERRDGDQKEGLCLWMEARPRYPLTVGRDLRSCEAMMKCGPGRSRRGGRRCGSPEVHLPSVQKADSPTGTAGGLFGLETEIL